MRPLISSSIVLAALTLSGVAIARSTDRHAAPEAQASSTQAAATLSDVASQRAGPTPAVAPSPLRVPLRPGSQPRFLPGIMPEGFDAGQPLLPQQSASREPYEFFFTRAMYSGGGLRGFGRRSRGGGSWATDYPKADRQFMVMVNHLIQMDAYPWDNAVSFADPAIRNFPWVYALEVGGMYLSPEEVQGMRDYLLAGGFLVIDDFWGTQEWANFEYNIRQVFPDRPIVELSLDHPIFHAFYNIEEIKQVPNVTNGSRGGPTWERDGYTPYVLGIFDEKGRLMVVINWNTDLGDAWEWAEDPWYPLEYSRFAAEMGINMIVYGMSH